MNSGHVTFLVNGYGLGNATRCHAVISKLAPGVQVTVLASGMAYEYFRQESSVRTIELKRAGPALKRLGFLPSSACVVLGFLLDLFAQSVFILSYLRRHPADRIVTDSIYSPVLILYRSRWIAINNSDFVVRNYRFRLSTLVQFLFVECLDYGFHRLFCKKVLSPRINDFSATLPFRAVPIIVRDSFETLRDERPSPSPASRALRVTVLRSGSGLGARADIDGIVHALHEQFPHIQLSYVEPKVTAPRITDSFSKVCEADLMICNAGFSSISEVLAARKPSLIVPLPGHAEQASNADLLLKEQIGAVVRKSSDLSLLRDAQWLERLRRRLQDYTVRLGGAQTTAELIVQSQRPALSDVK